MLARQESLFLQDIEAALGCFAGVQVDRHQSGISVKAAGPHGFDMTVMVENGRYALYFDNWTEDFDCDEIAMRTFAAALAGEARLRVDMLSGRRWRWTLETLDESGRWDPESTIGHVTWRFWGRPSSIYLRNTFVKRQSQSWTEHAALRAV
jgi:hypothetical protein